jgi:hypothetical protein
MMSTARDGFQLGRAGVALLVAVIVAAVVVGALALRDDGDSDDRMSFALSGSGGTATGDIRKLPSGWRIDLDADLPRLDNGQYYQAWLKDDAGTLVPIGTFNEGEDVVLWAGVSPLEFKNFTVTREKADGDQASSGDKVLTGTLETED